MGFLQLGTKQVLSASLDASVHACTGVYTAAVDLVSSFSRVSPADTPTREARRPHTETQSQTLATHARARGSQITALSRRSVLRPFLPW